MIRAGKNGDSRVLLKGSIGLGGCFGVGPDNILQAQQSSCEFLKHVLRASFSFLFCCLFPAQALTHLQDSLSPCSLLFIELLSVGISYKGNKKRMCALYPYVSYSLSPGADQNEAASAGPQLFISTQLPISRQPCAGRLFLFLRENSVGKTVRESVQVYFLVILCLIDTEVAHLSFLFFFFFVNATQPAHRNMT